VDHRAEMRKVRGHEATREFLDENIASILADAAKRLFFPNITMVGTIGISCDELYIGIVLAALFSPKVAKSVD